MATTAHQHVLHEGEALARAARETLIAAGEQWTDMRGAIFDALTRCTQPASAYDLAEAVGHTLQRRVAPNSVYRILDLFVSHNIALRVESRNAYIANAHPGCLHDCIFLVCTNCGKTVHLDDDVVGKTLREIAAVEGFVPEHPVIEVRGRCKDCVLPS